MQRCSLTTRLAAIFAALAFTISLLGPPPARAASKIQIMTATTDLASLAQEVGGDKVEVESIARGYQDPHFVDAKPSFLLKLKHADLLIVVGLELEIGWLPPLINQSTNPKIQVGAPGYLDASRFARILEIPTGQVTRSEGDVHPLGNPHYWLDPENGLRIAKGIADKLSEMRPGDAAVLRATLYRFRAASEAGRPKVARGDEAIRGPENCHLPPFLAEFCRTLSLERSRLR